MNGTVFRRRVAEIGELALRPVEALADAPLMQRWLSDPKSAYWLMGDLDAHGVARYSLGLAADPTQDAYIGLHDGRPAFLVERYDPAHSELAGSTRCARATSACTSSSPPPRRRCTASPAR